MLCGGGAVWRLVSCLAATAAAAAAPALAPAEKKLERGEAEIRVQETGPWQPGTGRRHPATLAHWRHVMTGNYDSSATN